MNSKIARVLNEKNLDRLILTEGSNGRVRIQNVESDDNSIPTDGVNISYMKQSIKKHVEEFLCGLNFDKMSLAFSKEDDGYLSIRIRNVETDDNSLPTDAVNVSYVARKLNSFRHDVERLETRIKNLEKIVTAETRAASVSYSRDGL